MGTKSEKLQKLQKLNIYIRKKIKNYFEYWCSNTKVNKNYYVGIMPTKNGFFEIYEVKIWYQPHKKSSAGWVDGWVDGWMDGW